jgi:hypothetical protein
MTKRRTNPSLAATGRFHRRGSIYLLVLAVATVLTMIGLAMVSVSRAGAKSLSQSQDWSEAQLLASSGVEHAIATINADTNWRTDYNGQTVTKSQGNGTFSWQLTDVTGTGLSNTPGSPFLIHATGTVGAAAYSTQVHVTIPSTGTGVGVVASSSVSLQGSAWIDSYDSSLGPYGGSNVGSKATVQTNSTSSGAVSLAWSTYVKGSVQIGPGGKPATVVSQASGANVTGTVSAMSQADTKPTLTAPTNLGNSTGDLTYQGTQNVNLSTNQHVGNFTVTASAVMNVTGSVTILAEGTVTFSGSGIVNIQPGASLTIYYKGAVTFTQSAVISLNAQKLSTFKVYNLGTGAVNISGGASVYQGVIVSPNGPVIISGSGQMGGALLTNQLTISGGSSFHEDRHISNGSDPVTLTGGGTSNGAPKPDAWTRVVQ